MNKRINLIKKAILLCLAVVMLTACGKKGLSSEDVVGTWTFIDESNDGLDITYVFNSDGTMSISSAGIKMIDGTYTIVDDTICYTQNRPNGKTDSGSWSVELGEDSLILTSEAGIARTYHKQ